MEIRDGRYLTPRPEDAGRFAAHAVLQGSASWFHPGSIEEMACSLECAAPMFPSSGLRKITVYAIVEQQIYAANCYRQRGMAL